jgi:transcriptional regulator with XRE-family HTH domain
MNETPIPQEQESLPADLSLSVLLFYTAMTKGIALSEFAEQLGVSPLSLRQFITGKAQRPRGKTLELLGEALGISPQEVRRRSMLRTYSAPRFSEWLKEKMEEGQFSRARLTQETRISDGALRNYLNGQTLPDASQARRLAETLDVDRLEIARVLVVDHIVRNGGQTIAREEQSPFSVVISGKPEDGQTSREWSQRYSQAAQSGPPSSAEEEHVITLWRKLHPQARRATLIYIAGLLAEA